MAKQTKLCTDACFDKVKTRGRPKLVLNDTGKEIITKMAEIMCTDEEIAACLGITVETLQNTDNNTAFLECKQKGNGRGKKALRRVQFDIAKKGNAAMAIFLGKQWLGQKEYVETKAEGKVVIVDNINEEEAEEYADESTDT